MVRLNKYLSDAGVCSRREADRLIESGQVREGYEIAEDVEFTLEDTME
ncbi:MAG: S4 domain-containing protein, partial [[Clostridium] scindens]